MQENQTLQLEHQQAITNTEQLLQTQREVSLCMEAMDAMQEFHLVAEDEVLLSEHQRALVSAFAQGNNNPHLPKVDAVISTKAAVESFSGTIDAIAKSAIRSLSSSVPDLLLQTAKTMDHYVSLSGTLLERMRKLRALLAAKGEESTAQVPVFSMGAFSRFLQSGGKEIDSFEAFAQVFSTQCALAKHDFIHGVNYSTLVADKILADLPKLQDPQAKDLREDLRKSVAYHWEKVWKQGFTVKNPGNVPAEFLKEFTESKVYPVCQLFDARMLVAVEPQKAREAKNLGKYRAVVVFDKKSPVKPSGAFSTPSAKDLLGAVDASIKLLNDMNYYKELVGKSKKVAKEFMNSRSRLVDALENKNDPKAVETVVQYMQIASSCGQIMVAPHIELAWLHLRSCLVVASIAEHVLFSDSKQRAVTAKFFADAKGPIASLDQERSAISTVIASIAKTIFGNR